MDEKDREIQKTREYSYVLWTIIVVLAIMIINLFAQQTCENQEFVNQVSFASTISSIILSVIAIIMTVVSNDSISSLLHKVRDLHDNIKDVPSDIKKTSVDLNESVKKLNSLEESLNKIPNELEITQKSISQDIERLRDMLDNATKKIEGIDQKTDILKEQLYSSHINEASSVEKTIDKEFLKQFIESLPLAAILAVYICISAKKKSMKFQLDDITRSAGLEEHQGYILAVIVVFKALRLIGVKQNEDATLEVLMVDETMKGLIMERLTEGLGLKIKRRVDTYWKSKSEQKEE